MSAVIRACAILARSFDSGSGHAGLGIPHQDALEASVAARAEYDSMRGAIRSAEQRELSALAELDESNAALRECRLRPAMQVVLEAEVLGLQRDLALLRPLLAAFEAMTDTMLKYNATCGHDALREGAKYEQARRASQSGEQIAPDSHEPAENTGNPR